MLVFQTYLFSFDSDSWSSFADSLSVSISVNFNVGAQSEFDVSYKSAGLPEETKNLVQQQRQRYKANMFSHVVENVEYKLSIQILYCCRQVLGNCFENEKMHYY